MAQHVTTKLHTGNIMHNITNTQHRPIVPNTISPPTEIRACLRTDSSVCIVSALVSCTCDMLILE